MQFHTTGIVLAALTVVSAASAQTTQAVEWKVSEGGNGHWYAAVAVSNGITWSAARIQALSLKGHLATCELSGEDVFVKQHFSRLEVPSLWKPQGPPMGAWFGPWVGAYQLAGSAEPDSGWIWMDGTAFDPRDKYCCNDSCGGPENYLQLYSIYPNFSAADVSWNDLSDDAGPCGGAPIGFVIEWDSDCNGDRIVDYGQILRGELIDLNANGVPDICETSVSSVIPPSVPSQGGSTITIRGNGFQANPTVRIGGVPATNVVRVSLTEITATSPALLPGMASVQVNDFTLADGIYIRPDCGSDLDQNGAVDGGDMSILLLDWGPCSNNLQASESQESLK